MIIGVTGTNGSGKGEVAEYLAKEKEFTHFSARAAIVAEIERRGLPVNRDTMTSVSIDMRAKNGADSIMRSLYEEAIAKGGNAVIESIREVPGAEFLKAHDGFLIAVDADKKIRYARIIKRGSSTDYVDFDTFVAQENREMQNADLAKQNVRKVMELADITLENNGTLRDLHEKIDAVLSRVQSKG